MPTVRPATSDELPQVGTNLAAAFADDPVWNFLSPDPARWEAHATPWFTADATAHHHGTSEVLVDDGLSGAAIWAAPGRWKPTVAETMRVAVPSLRLFGRNTVTALRSLSVIEKAHPRAPDHWYLAVIGTHPDHQGHGVGSALIRAVTDRCDEQGLASYLESSKESNVAFYARHGFDVRQTMAPAGGPPMWTMWREPRS